MTHAEFLGLVVAVLGEARRPNRGQEACLTADPAVPLLIVAGPGTGKTTVLVMRALRHVFVDRIPPEHIVITTFTKKAAREIRTRLIEWGTALLDHLRGAGAGRLAPDFVEFLRNVDINRFITGTLDSLCEEVLAADREPGERPAVVIENFAANFLLVRRGQIFEEWQARRAELQAYLAQFSDNGQGPGNIGEAARAIRTIIDRLVQDEVDGAAYVAPGPHLVARQAVARMFERYRAHLQATNQMDFAALERVFLDRLRAGRLADMIAPVRAVLVDEYQDTNPLQEQIYFELVRRTGASFTVVGDDDQSLYRFRGATIELFRGFATRAQAALNGARPNVLYLTENYRSTPEIITFFNDFIHNDPDFAPARVQPPKPPIAATRASENMPVVGLFRESAQDLATDLAAFLVQVFRGNGRPPDDALAEPIRRARDGGDFGDAVLISHTVNEMTRSYMGRAPRPRLPVLLRQALAPHGVACFNPRGRALRNIPEVQRMLGLVLECIDPSTPAAPDGPVTTALPITNAAREAMRVWRQVARDFIATNPGRVGRSTLAEVVGRWRRIARDGDDAANEWPVLDIFYNLMPWIPMFQDDPEHQVYLEAISRCAAQAATFSPYRALIVRNAPHRQRSVEAVIRDILAPIAEDLVEVDEEIMPSVPRDRLNIMTIHQAKGLEFPLVIVDVSSDFTSNHHTQRFRRFPDEPSSVARLEDHLAPATPIGPLRTQRRAIQRTFEDLTRLYYVAYSRPQSLLMLVGCHQCLRYNTSIRHIGTFWRRDESWAWTTPVNGRRLPAMANNLPLVLI